MCLIDILLGLFQGILIILPLNPLFFAIMAWRGVAIAKKGAINYEGIVSPQNNILSSVAFVRVGIHICRINI